MTKKTRLKHKIAHWIFIFLSAASALYGVMYLFYPHLMSYHLAFLEVRCEKDIPERMFQLYRALMQVSGAGMIAIGIASAVITMIPHKKEEPWAWWTLMCLFTFSLVPMFFTTFHIAQNITHGSKPPYYLTIIMFGLMLIAQILTFPYRLKKKDNPGY
jgi:cytochrome bd-type quinol oxidase subunit 2